MDNISKSEKKTPLLGNDYVQHYDSAGNAYVFGVTLIIALLMQFIPAHHLLTAAHFAAQQLLLTSALMGALLSLIPLLHNTKSSKKKSDPTLRKTGRSLLTIHLLFTMITAISVFPKLYGYLILSLHSDNPISHIFHALPIWVVLVVYGLFLGIATTIAIKKHVEHRSEIVDLSKLCNGCYCLLLSIPFSFILYLQDAQEGFGSRLLSTIVGTIILLLLYKVITMVGNFIYALTIRFKK